MAAVVLLLAAATQDAPLREQASSSLKKAALYYRSVSVLGSYPWACSEDLTLREGEGKITRTMGWVQPPGTPAIGMAYLDAWEATKDAFYLDAAREAAMALVFCQLRSGCWTYPMEFDPELRRKFAYRVGGGGDRAFNVSTLDDNTSQSALRLLIHVDKALEFKDKRIHEAAEFALQSLLAAQFANGGFSQGFQEPADPERYKPQKASFPETWPREWPKTPYWFLCTLNDNLFDDLTEVLLEAARIYQKEAYRAAAIRAADFLLLAQLPDPQPAWAQQYDEQMRPAWARRFEPPAVTGGESQRAMRVLMRIARETGDRKYLEPIPRALEYLRKSLLPNGELARFYEMGTNTPLYFTKEYVLTTKDDDLPTHYGFKTASRLDEIAKEYDRLKDGPLRPPGAPGRPRKSEGLEREAREAIQAQDPAGRWVEEGKLKNYDERRKIISSRTFLRHFEALTRYLAAE